MNFNHGEFNKGIYSLFFIFPVILFFASFLIGRYPVSPGDVIFTLLSLINPDLAVSETVSTVVFNIRLPRIIAAMVVGAALATVGATFQGIFKNPLVSPDILGVSSGAGFGAALAILANLGSYFIQASAFVFGLLSVFITYSISKVYKYSGILVLVLSGMAVSSFFGSLISSTKYLADPNNKLPEITFWLMGSLSSINVHSLLPVLIPIISGLIILFILRWRLNILAMGDEEAQAMGINTSKLRLFLIIISTLITAAAVSISGIIGWIGLIVPHMSRILTGPDNTTLIPASMSFGASFLLLMDNIARVTFTVEIPIGILTALIGAPLFLVLLKKGYSDWK
ncbi:FecCD family ABC transporter permease [Methanobrevibacter filiformis]|uniref:Putative ABC transporter permease protein n=1 Tax=Methanobrevibacter filiformis TaxID=55758 RepID=A0A166C8E9_9EURY|nr:iron ABC transporter permease [Methanobrevibacter filiformis]KZX12177.1 putative ABC transporter permease protein [Methanobrevibacter filiformis]